MVKKFVKNKKGFTLIELVVVVAILGVLALLIVPNVVKRVDEAREAVVDANIKVINNAIKMYYAAEGEYPDISNKSGTTDLEKLLTVLQSKEYLDADEVESAKKAFDGVTITVNKQENSNKVTSVQKGGQTQQGGNNQSSGGSSS
jgi:type II secretion system protein G